MREPSCRRGCLLTAWLRWWGAIANWTDYGIALAVALLGRTVSRVIVGLGCIGALGAFAMVGLPGGQAGPGATVLMVSRGDARVVLVSASALPTVTVETASFVAEASATETAKPIATPLAEEVAAAAAPTVTAAATKPPPPAVTQAPAPVATQAPATAVPATGARYTAAQVRDAARTAGWPENVLDEVVKVAQCESGLFSGAQGGGALGLMQIMPGWFPAAGVELSSWADPVANLAVARYVYNYELGNGKPPWSAWTCAP